MAVLQYACDLASGYLVEENPDEAMRLLKVASKSLGEANEILFAIELDRHGDINSQSPEMLEITAKVRPDLLGMFYERVAKLFQEGNNPLRKFGVSSDSNNRMACLRKAEELSGNYHSIKLSLAQGIVDPDDRGLRNIDINAVPLEARREAASLVEEFLKSKTWKENPVISIDYAALMLSDGIKNEAAAKEIILSEPGVHPFVLLYLLYENGMLSDESGSERRDILNTVFSRGWQDAFYIKGYSLYNSGYPPFLSKNKERAGDFERTMASNGCERALQKLFLQYMHPHAKRVGSAFELLKSAEGSADVNHFWAFYYLNSDPADYEKAVEYLNKSDLKKLDFESAVAMYALAAAGRNPEYADAAARERLFEGLLASLSKRPLPTGADVKLSISAENPEGVVQKFPISQKSATFPYAAVFHFNAFDFLHRMNLGQDAAFAELEKSMDLNFPFSFSRAISLCMFSGRLEDALVYAKDALNRGLPYEAVESFVFNCGLGMNLEGLSGNNRFLLYAVMSGRGKSRIVPNERFPRAELETALVEFFKCGAENGNALPMLVMSVLLDEGRLVAPDKGLASQYFKSLQDGGKFAKSEVANAFGVCGDALVLGNGLIRQDVAKAKIFYEIAAANGDKLSLFGLIKAALESMKTPGNNLGASNSQIAEYLSRIEPNQDNAFRLRELYLCFKHGLGGAKEDAGVAEDIKARPDFPNADADRNAAVLLLGGGMYLERDMDLALDYIARISHDYARQSLIGQFESVLDRDCSPEEAARLREKLDSIKKRDTAWGNPVIPVFE